MSPIKLIFKQKPLLRNHKIQITDSAVVTTKSYKKREFKPFVDERDHLGKLHDTQETARLYKNRESAQVEYNTHLHQLFLQSDIFNNMSPNLVDTDAPEEPQITERVS